MRLDGDERNCATWKMLAWCGPIFLVHFHRVLGAFWPEKHAARRS